MSMPCPMTQKQSTQGNDIQNAIINVDHNYNHMATTGLPYYKMSRKYEEDLSLKSQERCSKLLT